MFNFRFFSEIVLSLGDSVHDVSVQTMEPRSGLVPPLVLLMAETIWQFIKVPIICRGVCLVNGVGF